MNEKYLPIGTIVTLNGGTKKVMIVGYLPMGSDNRVFDYSACTFPEGVISMNKTLAFNHNQIKEINYMGLTNEESKEFSNKVKQMVENIKSLENIKFTGQEN